jgi:hypothetical protein
VTLRLQKKNIPNFYLITNEQAHYLQSKKFYFFANIFCLHFILQALFQPAQHLYEKREGSRAGYGAGSGVLPLTNGSRSGRPKSMRIRIRFRTRIPKTAVNYQRNNSEQTKSEQRSFLTIAVVFPNEKTYVRTCQSWDL